MGEIQTKIKNLIGQQYDEQKMGPRWNRMQSLAKHNLKKSDLNQSLSYSPHLFYYHCKGNCMELCWNWHALMLKISQIQTFTQKSDFIQTTFDLKVWIQTFAENSDQSGRPDLLRLWNEDICIPYNVQWVYMMVLFCAIW